MSAIPLDTAGCEIAEFSSGLGHASQLNHGNQQMQVAQLEAATDAISPFHRFGPIKMVMQT
jgi:hypothetical protein